MNQLKEFDHRYLKLILEINKHVDGYIDAYIGPPELKQQIDGLPLKSPLLLQEEYSWLLDNMPTEDAARYAHMTALLRAIGTTIQILSGEEIPYMEEVQRIYDIMPQRISEDRFLLAKNQLDMLLPGSGPLSGRIEAWRASYVVPRENMPYALQLVRDETRERTKALVDLPAAETVEVELVNNQPWGAYNWFKGQSRSLIEFNTDIPNSALTMVALFAHEGYPGHHTEAVLKEQKFWHSQGYGEAGAMLLHSPAAVIAEGIATTAVEIIFPSDEHLDWTIDSLLPALSMETEESSEHMRLLQQAFLTLYSVTGNAAIAYHTGQISKEQTIEYLQTYGLVSPERAEKSLSFISHPLFRSYAFTYSEGYNLISKAATAGDKRDVFLSCLTEQKLPSQLAAQGARLAQGS